MSYRQRSEWIEDAKMRVLQNTKRTDEAARELIFLYDEAAYNVEKEINALFARFARDNALTDAQASQLLSGREYSTWRKLLFNVVQTVFNGIASVVSSVWSKVKPIVEGIGNGLSWVAGKVKGLLGMGGGDSGSVGSNAEGTNNWRGGPTWVGERGPELVDLPKGSRVLPNKESVQLAQNAARPVVREIFQTTTVEKPVVREVIQNTVEKPAIYKTEGNSSPVLERIEKGLGVVTGLLGRDGRRGQDEDTPGKPPKRPDNGQDFPPPPDPSPKAPRPTAAAQTPLQVTVAKLADKIIMREDADIDRIGEAVAKRVVQAARNMAPA